MTCFTCILAYATRNTGMINDIVNSKSGLNRIWWSVLHYVLCMYLLYITL